MSAGQPHRSEERLYVDEAFHYSAELLELLAETIALLFRSKRGVLLFFHGAGLRGPRIDRWAQRVRVDRENVRKAMMARDLLVGINEAGDKGIRLRREILKRVYEREDYSTCWPKDEDDARGKVSRIRQIVDQKDAFTRIQQIHTAEYAKRAAAHRADVESKQRTQERRNQVRDDLFGLFAEQDPHRRGRVLESVLNRLFECHGILVRKSLTLHIEGQTVEQIDGVVEIDGHLYLVEMKWWGKPLGVAEISEHLLRVYDRAEVRAIIISESGFTAPAVARCERTLAKKIVVLCGLDEVVRLLQEGGDLKELFRRKIHAAAIERQPLVK